MTSWRLSSSYSSFWRRAEMLCSEGWWLVPWLVHCALLFRGPRSASGSQGVPVIDCLLFDHKPPITSDKLSTKRPSSHRGPTWLHALKRRESQDGNEADCSADPGVGSDQWPVGFPKSMWSSRGRWQKQRSRAGGGGEERVPWGLRRSSWSPPGCQCVRVQQGVRGPGATRIKDSSEDTQVPSVLEGRQSTAKEFDKKVACRQQWGPGLPCHLEKASVPRLEGSGLVSQRPRPPGLLCLWLSLELILNLAILKHFVLIKFILGVLEKGSKTFSFYLGSYVHCVIGGDLLGIHKYIFSNYDKKGE